MASEWRDFPFSAAVKVNPHVELKRGNTYPFVDMQAVNAGSRYVDAGETRVFEGGGSRFSVGDTLMARITPCLENGKIAQFCACDRETAAHGSTEFIVIRGREGITDTDYAYYLTKWEGVSGYAVGQMTGTSGRQRVPTESLDHLTVHIPPLSEQRAIAHILGTLDDKIELNRRMNETLEGIARAIFKSWFVDFDPVRAKAEGRDPSLPKHIGDLFPKSFEDSELGEIPKGWLVRPLPSAILVNPPRPLRKGDVAPYLEMANMPTQGHTPDFVTNRPFGSGMRFAKGDTLIARITPCLENGKTAFVDFLQEDEIGWGSTEYIILRPKPPLPEEFAYCLARSEAFREFAIQSMTGSSGRQRVPADSLQHFLLPIPPPGIA
jgi:type I restriction enzyme S subunit